VNIKEKALNETKEFWKLFYAKHNLRDEPSSFAYWCLENYIDSDYNIFEIGCGNGRDSFAFLANGNSIFAIDGCEVAIDNNNTKLMDSKYKDRCKFKQLDFNHLDKFSIEHKQTLQNINIFYSRFVLHAIPEILEDKILNFAYDNMSLKSLMIHEFRTNKDPLSKKGMTLSSNEMLTDHYRRFIDLSRFIKKVTNMGFELIYSIESDNLAIFKEDNPVVARVVFRKRKTSLAPKLYNYPII